MYVAVFNWQGLTDGIATHEDLEELKKIVAATITKDFDRDNDSIIIFNAECEPVWDYDPDMDNEEVTFKVQYIGHDNEHFTYGHIYTVLSVDEDGDYILLDDHNESINHFSTFFEEITE